jgi:hypothetical protein
VTDDYEGARERERDEMLAELVPAMESRGYNTVALKALLGE